MVKQGGVSWNTNIPSKKGIQGNHKCNVCGRGYKQQWTKNNHEIQCQQQNKINKGKER